ncbi:GNAT family N-acetyltransferase [Pseudomonas sp. N040]|uniref:GNAT family N-acetyltransferase n=1 Tax=Pseudomonas sp. N040 TaxID=2785325 RepID=UPI0018A32414|nr:GNAT family N-acetyltransferase [Pseudomonas sp. N040]MBF7728975.1 GNAT family N-acetyltransferase [Pseudomonas sp. N040]MBW7012615.1 GNAT family N-acetyltransferase [Pseudomonas sp. N040]
MPNLQIRPVSAADHAAWLPLWQAYQRFYNAVIAEQTSAITWQRFLDPAEPMHAALAWQDGVAVGLVHWIFHRSCWTVSDYCYLQDLYVAESGRGAGVGRALIEQVYAAARAAGANRVHWLTQEDNARARQLYERIASRSGFIQYRQLFTSPG